MSDFGSVFVLAWRVFLALAGTALLGTLVGNLAAVVAALCGRETSFLGWAQWQWSLLGVAAAALLFVVGSAAKMLVATDDDEPARRPLGRRRG